MENLEIIKIGGKVLDNPDELSAFIEDFVKIKGKKILVHGGGKLSTSVAASLGVESKFVDGRRITDPESLKVAVMVYAGWVNKSLVASLQEQGQNCLGLTGADLNVIKATKRNHPEIDFGLVGDISKESINVPVIISLLEAEIVPVFCAITHDGLGDLLNTNADTIAACLASALGSKYNTHLTYCFEYKGVLKNVQDPESWIEKLKYIEYRELVETGAISEGMLPKLENAFAVLKEDVKSVRIRNAQQINTNQGTLLQLE